MAKKRSPLPSRVTRSYGGVKLIVELGEADLLALLVGVEAARRSVTTVYKEIPHRDFRFLGKGFPAVGRGVPALDVETVW